ncbi:hypothetical protein F4861DRAFT_325614 [Xylaria intraflava]|nr:hypothetical protein F4861DRAFT_325614 [Xylaria intraflava]
MAPPVYPEQLPRPPTPPPPDHVNPPYLVPRRPTTREERIAQLQEDLTRDDEFWPYLRKNVAAILRLYQEGKLKQGDVVYAQDGNVYFDEAPPPIPGKFIFVEILMDARLTHHLGGTGQFQRNQVLFDTGCTMQTMSSSDLEPRTSNLEPRTLRFQSADIFGPHGQPSQWKHKF